MLLILLILLILLMFRYNIVYTAGKYGVVYTKDGNTQTFFDKHDDDITCLDVDGPSGRFAASGQRGVSGVVLYL